MRSKQQRFRAAKQLSRFDTLDNLAPEEFQRQFDALYRGEKHVGTLLQLGVAATYYLRKELGKIAVPHDLPLRLLSSRQIDARLVGLKLLVRLRYPAPLIVDWICRALRSASEHEAGGGLHELGLFLDYNEPLSPHDRQTLWAQLQPLLYAPEPWNHEVATRLMNDERLA